MRWENRVEEYMRERNQGRMQGLGYARHACMDRSNWRLFCRGHPLGGSSRRERGVRAIDSISFIILKLLIEVERIARDVKSSFM